MYGVSRMEFSGLNLYTEWAGTIEGNVRAVNETPGFAFLELQNADGTPVSAEIQHEVQTSNDGAFRFERLPTGGRYILRMNPYGPKEYSPYASLYYPSASRREEAAVLEINEKEQHLQNLNFKVKPLVERTLPIRVAWPKGGPIDDAFFCITYEQGGEWEREHALRQCGGTEANGMAELPVFGDGPVRVFAYAFVDKNKKIPPRYSRSVQLEPATLPQMLDLTITSSDPPY
jgi:hypothetical protein